MTSSTSNSIQKYINLLQPSSSTSNGNGNGNGYTNAIIQRALSDSNLYSGFAQLRSLPAVQRLGQPLINTLDLFSYGTYSDYSNAAEGTYGTLTDAQLFKLKALTVVSVVHRNCEHAGSGTGSGSSSGKGAAANANSNDNDGGNFSSSANRALRRQRRRNHPQNNHQEEKTPQTPPSTIPSSSCNTVPYTILRSATGLANTNIGADSVEIRQLEDLLIHCIYSNLLPTGSKLDQKHMCLVCNLSASTSASTFTDSTHVLCRDIHLEKDLPDMIQALEVLYTRGQDMELKLKDSLMKLRNDADHDLQEWNQVDLQMQLAKSDVGSKSAAAGVSTSANAGKTLDGGAASAFGPEVIAGQMMEWASAGANAGARQVKRSRGGSGGKSSRGMFGFGSNH